MKARKIVLKLSSGLLVKDKLVQHEWLEALATVVATLRAQGLAFNLVTSGATALGKLESDKKAQSNAFYALIGQPLLMELYTQVFSKVDVQVAEVLLSKDDFSRRDHYLAIRDQLEDLERADILPLINENDAIAGRTHIFSDNDEIAGLVASMQGAERLILASTVEGVLTADGAVVKQFEPGDSSWRTYVDTTSSSTGRGGMLLKCQAASASAKRGIEAVICDGKDHQMIEQALTGAAVGTRFVADRSIAAKKRWLLDHASFAKGAVVVDQGAAAALQKDGAVSVLTVGVTAVRGDFDENEIVAVRWGSKVIGYGQVRLPATEVRRLVKTRTKQPLIHYDNYMGIEQ